ncbi:MAG: alpha/beta hydrolase [Chloroflexi bacterium]|nr:alpha/beta hydrolase [Chloroflexota bacterium]
MSNYKADDGSLINYETFGESTSRDTLLLLPGLMGSISSQWRQFIPSLIHQFRVVLVDLRGHGHSENKAPTLAPEQMMHDLNGLLDSLHVEHYHVAGYSLGGYLGLLLHLNQPRRVQTVLMHATKFYWNEESVKKMGNQLDPDAITEKVPQYANQLAQEHGSRWRKLVRQAAELVHHTWKDGLTEGMVKQAQGPVLVSVGDRDELVQIPEALRLSRIMSHGELIVLPGVKHPFKSIRPVPLVPMMLAFHRTPDRR